jgi:hypothetical protein
VRALVVALVLVACAKVPITPWDHTPVTVDAPASPVLDRAIKDWNDAAGCVVLVRHPAPADVVVIVADEFSHHAGTYTPPPTGGAGAGPVGAGAGPGTVRLFYAAQGDDVEGYQVTLHELGHALGLGHDGWQGSVMNPNGAAGLMDGPAGADVDMNPSFTVIESETAKAVRRAYCR